MDYKYDRHEMANEAWKEALDGPLGKDTYDGGYAEGIFKAAFVSGWESAAIAASHAAYLGGGGFHGTWNRALEGMGFTLEESEKFAGLPPFKPLGGE